MADNRPKMSTCPICGFTDTADDAEALQSAIEEHIRLSHNLDPATLGGTAGAVKSVSAATANDAGGDYSSTGSSLPIIPIAANSSGTGGAPTAPNAVLAAGVIANEDTLNTPNAERQNEHRNDETDNFS